MKNFRSFSLLFIATNPGKNIFTMKKKIDIGILILILRSLTEQFECFILHIFILFFNMKSPMFNF